MASFVPQVDLSFEQKKLDKPTLQKLFLEEIYALKAQQAQLIERERRKQMAAVK